MMATLGGLTFCFCEERLRNLILRPRNLVAVAEEEPTNQRFVEVVAVTPFSNAANS